MNVDPGTNLPVDDGADPSLDYDTGGVEPLDSESVRLPIKTDWVKRWDRVVRRSGVVPLLEQWAREDANRPADYNKRGPKRAISTSAVLTLLCLASRNMEPATVANITRIITDGRLKHDGYLTLGVKPPARDTNQAKLYKHTYEQVRDCFHQFLSTMDAEPHLPWRRIQRWELDRIVAAAHTDPERERVTEARRALFNDAIVHAALQDIPPEIMSRWEGDVVVDATFLAVRGKRGTRSIQKGEDPEQRKLDWVAFDAFAGRYHREGDHSGNDATPNRGATQRVPADRPRNPRSKGATPNRGTLNRTKEVSMWGREASIVLMSRSMNSHSRFFPLLAVGVRVHNPGSRPAEHAVSILQGARNASYPVGTLVGDRVYGASPKTGNYQTPARELGYQLVHDYRVDQVGRQHTTKSGLILVDGQFYSPCLPDNLASAEYDWRNKLITAEQRDARLQERQGYRARPKGGPDPRGKQRFECMAEGPNATGKCPMKEYKRKATARGGLTTVPETQVPAHKPDACLKGSVTIYADEGAKYRMDLPFKSKEWKARYSSARQEIESFNDHVKGGSYGVLGDTQSRPMRGLAAQSVLVAIAVAAANHIKYIHWRDEWGNVKKSDPEPAGSHTLRNATWGRRSDQDRDYETDTDPPENTA